MMRSTSDERLRELLTKVFYVNHILLDFYDLPILEKINKEIQKELDLADPVKNNKEQK